MDRNQLSDAHRKWFSDVLLPQGADATSVLQKLQEELDELVIAHFSIDLQADDPERLAIARAAHAQEVADIGICLTIYAGLMGVDEPAEQEKKLKINRARTWVRPPGSDVFRHEQ